MILILLTIIFIGRSQPIIIVIRLIFITLFYSYWVMKLIMRFWFRYALIMVMLSGVFVIFIYIASLIPNEEFEIYGIGIFIIFMFIIVVWKNGGVGEEILEWVRLNLWLSYLGGVLVFLGVVLFIVILIVIWVRCKGGRALRVI